MKDKLRKKDNMFKLDPFDVVIRLVFVPALVYLSSLLLHFMPIYPLALLIVTIGLLSVLKRVSVYAVHTLDLVHRKDQVWDYLLVDIVGAVIGSVPVILVYGMTGEIIINLILITIMIVAIEAMQFSLTLDRLYWEDSDWEDIHEKCQNGSTKQSLRKENMKTEKSKGFMPKLEFLNDDEIEMCVSDPEEVRGAWNQLVEIRQLQAQFTTPIEQEYLQHWEDLLKEYVIPNRQAIVKNHSMIFSRTLPKYVEYFKAHFSRTQESLPALNALEKVLKLQVDSVLKSQKAFDEKWEQMEKEFWELYEQYPDQLDRLPETRNIMDHLVYGTKEHFVLQMFTDLKRQVLREEHVWWEK